MFKEGDIVISRNRIEQVYSYESIIPDIYCGPLWLTKYKEYKLQKKFNSFGATYFIIYDDMNEEIHLNLQEFNRYFLSKDEIRKKKLQKIRKKKLYDR